MLLRLKSLWCLVDVRILSQWSSERRTIVNYREVNIMELSHHGDQPGYNTCCYTLIINTGIHTRIFYIVHTLFLLRLHYIHGHIIIINGVWLHCITSGYNIHWAVGRAVNSLNSFTTNLSQTDQNCIQRNTQKYNTIHIDTGGWPLQ